MNNDPTSLYCRTSAADAALAAAESWPPEPPQPETDSDDGAPGAGSEPGTVRSEAPDVADAPDTLTKRLPHAYQGIVGQLVHGTGLDPLASTVLAISVVVNWAGRLQIQMPCGTELTAALPLALGLPLCVDAELVEHTLLRSLAGCEREVLKKLMPQPFDLIPPSPRDEAGEPCTFLLNPKRKDLEYALAHNTSQQLFIALSGDGWASRYDRGPFTADLWYMAAVFQTGGSGFDIITVDNRKRILKREKRTIDVTFLTLCSSAHLKEIAIHDNYHVRVLLNRAVQLLAENRRRDPAGTPFLSRQPWDELLRRASTIRAGRGTPVEIAGGTAKSLRLWEDDTISILSRLPQGEAMMNQGVINLPLKFMAGLMLADWPASRGDEWWPLAIELAVHTRERHFQLQKATKRARASDFRSAHRARLLEKIQSRSWSPRDLMRTETIQRRDYHWPVIEELIRQKLVKLEPNGWLSAVSMEAP